MLYVAVLYFPESLQKLIYRSGNTTCSRLIRLLTSVHDTANTHPKQVLNANGVPEGPNLRPWTTVQLKTSAPSNKSTLPRVLKSISANEMFLRCFHLRLKGIGCDGRTDVILGSTKACASRIFPSSRTILYSSMQSSSSVILESNQDCAIHTM